MGQRHHIIKHLYTSAMCKIELSIKKNYEQICFLKKFVGRYSGREKENFFPNVYNFHITYYKLSDNTVRPFLIFEIIT